MNSDENRILLSKAINMSPLRLPECIHLSELGRCNELNVKECLGAKCSFRQKMIDKNSSVIKWHVRLNSLDLPEQKRIADKYYGGTMPWTEHMREV